VGLTQNGADLLVPGDVKISKSVTLKVGAPLAGGDVHLFLAAGTADSGDAVWTVKIKQPKSYAFSMPGVAAGE
jgi:hypothetical protein